MDWESAVHIWDAQADGLGGLIPLNWLLLNRLNDLWDELHRKSVSQEPRFDDFQKLLLFPTRNPPRKNSKIEIPSKWHEDPAVVDGFGGYMSTTNFANNLTNPIFDYVSEQTRSYPEHRQNLPANKRKGWTMHALRHFFVTSNIYHGIPIPQISEMAGHASVDFTSSRYTHAMKQDYKDIGFE
jgi:integrase